MTAASRSAGFEHQAPAEAVVSALRRKDLVTNPTRARRAIEATPRRPRRFISASTFGEAFGVTAKTVIRWIQAGRCACELTPGGHYRIPVSEIARLKNKSGQLGQAGHLN